MNDAKNIIQLLIRYLKCTLKFFLFTQLFFSCINQNNNKDIFPQSDPEILTAGRHFLHNSNDAAHAWIVDLKWTLGAAEVLTEFAVEWVVPSAPSEQGNQTIYYFPGLHEVAILQPVLQWGKSAIGGGEYWSVASWYVVSALGPYHATPLVKVNPGDRCKSQMLYKGYNGKTYQYESHIEVNGVAQKPLLISSKYYLKNVYLTLEDYKVDRCTKHSASGTFKFENIVIKGKNIPTTIPWEKKINPHIICHENIRVLNPTATLEKPGSVVITFDNK